MWSGNYGNSTVNKKQSNSTNLYVKNFGKEINETKLWQLFATYGTITSCKIQTDSNGQSKGFGFVNFERPEMAQHAMEKLNGYLLDNDTHLYVALFQRKSERKKVLRQIHEENHERQSNNLCLYVSNLDIMIDEKLLETIFSRFGRVIMTHILRDGNQSKGIGFVCFNTIEETTRALNEMNGQWILSKPIYVKLSKDTDNSKLITSNSPMPFNLPAHTTRPSMIPMPYLNFPAMFYVPTVMVPTPLNHFPLPTAPPNSQVQSTNVRPLLPPPPPVNHFFFPTPLPNSQVRSTSIRPLLPSPPPPIATPIKRQSYPYTPVKSDDQQNDI